MNATLTKPAVIATIDEVLNALAVYRERDAAIEDLELRIHVDRSHLLTSTATVELVEALDYYEKELSAELGEPSDGTRAAALEDIRDVLRARLLELTRPESVANPEQPSSPD